MEWVWAYDWVEWVWELVNWIWFYILLLLVHEQYVRWGLDKTPALMKMTSDVSVHYEIKQSQSAMNIYIVMRDLSLFMAFLALSDIQIKYFCSVHFIHHLLTVTVLSCPGLSSLSALKAHSIPFTPLDTI